MKLNEDYIIVDKQLFKYLNDIYGCDYYIQAKRITSPTNKFLSPNKRAGSLNST